MITRRFAIVAVILSAFALSACGDSEPTQRKAFIDFLQTRILNSKSAVIPALTDEMKTSFGPYAAHYAVFSDFDKQANGLFKEKFEKYASLAKQVNNLKAIQERWREIQDFRGNYSKEAAVSLKKLAANANATRAALKQPDDLKAVYDKAFDQVITRPVTIITDLFPVLDAALESMVKTGQFLDENKGKVTLNGMTMITDDNALLKKYNLLMEDYNANAKQVMSVSSKAMKELSGR